MRTVSRVGARCRDSVSGCAVPGRSPAGARLVETRRRVGPAEPGAPPGPAPSSSPGPDGVGGAEAHQLLDGRHPPTPDAGADGSRRSCASRQPPPSRPGRRRWRIRGASVGASAGAAGVSAGGVRAGVSCRRVVAVGRLCRRRPVAPSAAGAPGVAALGRGVADRSRRRCRVARLGRRDRLAALGRLPHQLATLVGDPLALGVLDSPARLLLLRAGSRS